MFLTKFWSVINFFSTVLCLPRLSFWKAEARISEQLYESNWLVMGILRVFGVFPLKTVRNHKSELFLKPSPLYVLYSYALGLTSICFIYYAQFVELVVNGNAMYTLTQTDKFVRFSAINGYCVLVLYTTLNMPNRVKMFFEYLKCIDEIDSAIKMRFTKSDKYKSIAIISAFLLGALVITSGDVYLSITVHKRTFLDIFKASAPFHLMSLIAFAILYTNRHMAHSLEKRVSAMNRILKVEIDSEFEKMEKEPMKNETENVKVLRRSQSCGPMICRKATLVWINQSKEISVNKLSNIYLKLVEAGEILNDLFGINCVIALWVTLFHLMMVWYFVILILEGKTKSRSELVHWLNIFFHQLSRLLLTIDPWYACLVQFETMKGQVCQLLTRNVRRYYRQQVKHYSVILCLRNFTFSAWDLFDVDRTLYTALIENTTTWLVISLDAKSSDTS